MSTTSERMRTLVEKALRANRLALVALAMATATFSVGCAGDDSTDEVDVVDSVDSVEQEIVAADVVHDGSDSGDEDVVGLPSNQREQETDQGAPSPGDLCSEPVPHPWVPKVHRTDNDT